MSSYDSAVALPSSAYVALALVTVRLKPSHISVQDYLTMLSDAVVPAGQDGHGEQERLNAAYFWKEAYERAEVEKSQVQDYIYRFEQERHRLSAEEQATSKKRKADSPYPAQANTHSKRREIERGQAAEAGPPKSSRIL